MSWRSLVDDGLELTVVGSFPRLGYVVRRWLYDWSTPAPGALDGRTVLVTGPTSGLGRAAADELAALGARVILVGRSKERLANVRNALISRHHADRFPTVVADMGSLRSIAEAVATIRATEPRLDVVVDNAGAIFPTRTVGPDGIEGTFATLVVGPFALVSGLLPLLRQAEGARVIAVTSGGMYGQRLDLEDLQSRARPYSGTRAYARAKRAQVALVREWARRLGPAGITFNAMHPGWADTPGLAESLPGFHRLMRPILRTVGEGVDTLVWLAAAPEAGALSGRLFLDRRPRPFDRIPLTRLRAVNRRRLWDLVVDLSRTTDPRPDA
jgi:NAD(P)-dependent dehydrogenase (short-subunit alcohol dehydrogenase family)